MTKTKMYLDDFRGMSVGNYFGDWSLWEKMWLGISTLLILVASIWTWDTTNQVASWTALLSSITGIWCVVLVAKAKISNYVFGIINCILYAYASYSWRLYGDAMLNAFYFLPMQFYGINIWLKNKKNIDDIKVKIMSTRSKVIWLMLSLLAVLAYGTWLKSLNGLTPYFDATSTVFSVVAMILMAKLYKEQWILWIFVDIVTVGMWANIVFNEGGLFNMGILIMWVCWLANAVYGLINWNKLEKE